MSEQSDYQCLASESVQPFPSCDLSFVPPAGIYLQSDLAGFERVLGAGGLVHGRSKQWSNECVSIESKTEPHSSFQRRTNDPAPIPSGNPNAIMIETKKLNVSRPSTPPIPTRADDILRMVLTDKMKRNEEGLTPLHLACRFCPDNAMLVAKILEAKPSLAKFPFRSKISKASRRMFDPCVKQRTSRKRKYATGVFKKLSPIDLLASDKHSYPIHIALAHNCSLEVAGLLVKQAPDILLVGDGNGLCPLGVALRCGASEDIIGLLLSMDKDSVRCLDNRMNLPLHHACIRGCSIRTAKKLSQAYPNAVHKKNFNGKTQLELLQSNNACNDEVYSYLQSVAFQEKHVEEVDC